MRPESSARYHARGSAGWIGADVECGGVAGSPCAGVRSVCRSPSVSRSDCRVRAWGIPAFVVESARHATMRGSRETCVQGLFEVAEPAAAARAGEHDWSVIVVVRWLQRTRGSVWDRVPMMWRPLPGVGFWQQSRVPSTEIGGSCATRGVVARKSKRRSAWGRARPTRHIDADPHQCASNAAPVGVPSRILDVCPRLARSQGTEGGESFTQC